jgi:hypothetical protein
VKFAEAISNETKVKVLKIIRRLQPVSSKMIAVELGKTNRWIQYILNEQLAAGIVQRVFRYDPITGAMRKQLYALTDFEFEVVP